MTKVGPAPDRFEVADDIETNKCRNALEEFLVCLGTYSPEHFMYTVIQESTSYEWVLKRIQETFNLNTKGVRFLAGCQLKTGDGEEAQTHQQKYQAVREWCCSSLLKKGDRYKGKALDKDEVLTPFGENIIVEKWLDNTHLQLKAHIMQTRGSLFTEERPNLSDNQKQICEQMEVLLQEIELKEKNPSINRTGFAPPSRQQRHFTPRPSYPIRAVHRPAHSGAGQTGGMAACPPNMCRRCYEAGRHGPASRTHFAADCPNPDMRRSNQRMKILFVPTQEPVRNGPVYHTTPQAYQNSPQIQEIQLTDDLLQQEDQYEMGQDQLDDDYYEDPNISYDFTNMSLNKYSYPYICPIPDLSPTINLIPTRSIQKFTFLSTGKQAQAVLAIDSGCEGNCMREDEVNRLGFAIKALDEDDLIPNQADGKSPLDTVGQVVTTFCRNGLKLKFHGYVVKNLSQPILCGLPFMVENDITQHINRGVMVVQDKVIAEDPPLLPGNRLPTNIQQTGQDPPASLLSKIEVGSKVPKNIKDKLNKIHMSHQQVFDGDLTLGYNGLSGDFDVDFDFNNDVPPPPHKGSFPPYYKRGEEEVLQAKIEELERQNIVAKVSDLGINLRLASPCMLARKVSSKNMPVDEYNKLSVAEKAKLHRFVLCQNKLSNYINKKPALTSHIQDTINLVGGYEFVITSDLQDSFNQRLIREDKLAYMGFHSPFGDDYVFLRSPQGLLNQSEELERLIKTVLVDGIKAGHVRVHADNIYVLGRTFSDTVDRWERVLHNLQENNLKLSSKKTSCFPDKLDLLGWSKEGAFLVPDPHRKNTLLTAEKPTNIKELRSFLGTYHTFYKCHDKQNIILAPLTKLLADKPAAGQKIVWTKDLEAAFKKAQDSAKELDKLYIPKPSDQLVLTSDYAAKGTDMKAGISATLWAKVKEDWQVVARMSAEIPPQMKNLDPCDGEAAAVYVAGKSPAFTVPIRASNEKTHALVDSKPVSDAAKLLLKGKFSSSRMINYVLAAISELNLEFHHMSGKMKYNCPDDFSSRNPAKCDGNKSCKIHTFISECMSLTVASLSLEASNSLHGIIGQIQADKETLLSDILSGKARLPLANRHAMAYLQGKDRDLLRVRELLTAGQRPSSKRDVKAVKVFFRSDVTTSVDKSGCIIVIKQNRNNLVKRELVAVPNSISMGILYSLHINLGHPTNDQLHRVVDTRFFVQDIINKCTVITTSCTLCTSAQPIPEELHEFKANEVPDHPGEAFTIDVMKECKKLVIVAVDNFSAYVSTNFITSEKEEDLRDGIIATISPFMANSLSKVRVDRAPGFAKMKSQKEVLDKLGIDLELGEAKNKNSLAIADQKIKELRSTLKKISPSSNVLNQTCLSRATTIINEKIRHHRLSAKEVHFSREATTNEPIQVDDDKISNIIKNKREKDNNSKLNSASKKVAKSADASEGQLVFIKSEGDKRSRRDLYLVLSKHLPDNTLTVCKVRDALSNKMASIAPHDSRLRYVVKQTEVILAPNQPEVKKYHTVEVEEDLEEEEAWEEEQDDHCEQTINNETDLEEDLEDLWVPIQPLQRERESETEEEDYEADEENFSDEQDYESHSDGHLDIPPNVPHIANDDQLPLVANDDDNEEVENSEEEPEETDSSGTDPQQGAAGGQHHVLVIDVKDQSRQPAKEDIIAFVRGDFWIRARIINKVTGYRYYYNVEMEDGSQDGVELKPPTSDYEESWTLLDKDMWHPLPREQLLDNTADMPSREATPVTTGTQDRVTDQLYQLRDTQHHLQLDPYQQLQVGRVHLLPNNIPLPPPHAPVTLQWPAGTDPKYAKRVEELVNSNTLPPSQHMSRIQMAMHQAAAETQKKENSLAMKVKKALTRKK